MDDEYLPISPWSSFVSRFSLQKIPVKLRPRKADRNCYSRGNIPIIFRYSENLPYGQEIARDMDQVIGHPSNWKLLLLKILWSSGRLRRQSAWHRDWNWSSSKLCLMDLGEAILSDKPNTGIDHQKQTKQGLNYITLICSGIKVGFDMRQGQTRYMACDHSSCILL